MKFFIFFSLLIFLGCATPTGSPKAYLGGAAYVKLPKAEDIFDSVRAVQIITIRHADSAKVFEAILERKLSRLTISILSPLWPTPLKVVYDGQKISVDEALKKIVPVDFKYILADLFLVFAKQEIVEKSLNQDARFEQIENVRTIFDTSRASRQDIVRIKYQNVNPLSGVVSLENLTRRYQIEVKTLKVEKL